MPTSEQIAETFRNLDFHDDSLVQVSILPAKSRQAAINSAVEIHLSHYSDGKPRVIQFSGCANVRVAMDFDVLADNFPPNTSRVDAATNPGRIRNLVESQMQDWDVRYTGTAKSPVSKKLSDSSGLIFFRMQFFGGVVDIIARDFQVESDDEPTQTH